MKQLKLTPENIESETARLKTFHGDKYTYQIRAGIRPNLRELKKGESICGCYITGCHFLLTEVDQFARPQSDNNLKPIQ
jgi:hypothetical protein